MRYWDKLAGEWYLDFLVATNYPEQCPQSEVAKGRDLLWLLIPIVGFLIFIDTIDQRYIEENNHGNS